MRLIKLTAVLTIVGVCFLSFINETAKPAIGLKIGDRAPEINSKLISGVDYLSTDFKGQMLLIDFWASYDASSRVDNHLKAGMVEKYQNQEFLKGTGLTIVSISLDRFKNPLIKSIESDQMNYPFHICDFKGRESDIVNKFEAFDLKKILVDGDGRIVAVSSDMSVIASALNRLSTP
ncbi:MAG: TlpA family protein disulfide reductase [Marinilabiliaceae bacterium]|nr:TlpA family protein disulfide reductase [Marinilabiliaceae bacterium]